MYQFARMRLAAPAVITPPFAEKNELFWNLHDFLFEHQRELKPENVHEKLLAHAPGMAGLDLAQFQACIAQGGSKAAIEREVAFASQNGIEATPSVFLNGKQIDVGEPEQLQAAIRRTSRSSPAASPTVTSAESGVTPGR